MMNVVSIDRATTRQMIIDMKGGILDEKDQLALAACTHNASHTWLCTVDDRPVAAWGLVPPTILSDRAYLWLYSTPAVEDHKFLFIRRSQIVMEEMQRLYPTIYGVCEIGNDRAIRWIRWLGTEFGIPGSIPGMIPFVIQRKGDV